MGNRTDIYSFKCPENNYPTNKNLKEISAEKYQEFRRYRIKAYFAIVISISLFCLFCLYKILESDIHHNEFGQGFLILILGAMFGYYYVSIVKYNNKANKNIFRLLEINKDKMLFDSDKKLIYWNNYDTIFTEKMLISVQNENFFFFKYSEIDKIKMKSIIIKGQRGRNTRYDYIIFVLKSGYIFKILLDKNIRSSLYFDIKKTNTYQIISFIKEKNKLVQEEKIEEIIK